MSAAPQTDNVPKVYAAIAAVTEALSKEGITKSRKNQSQGYNFRGIDDIYNALASELAKNKLCILPRVLERTCEERVTKSGSTLFYVNVTVAFDFVSAEDGSKHEVITVGEAMDSGDKATNKSQSAAYKYAALMAFCIPTEGDNDTENTAHEVKPKQITPLSKTKPEPSTKQPPAVSVNELAARANIFGAQIAGCSTKETLTATVIRGNKLLLDLKNAEHPDYGRLMKEISAKQNEYLEGKEP